MGAPRVLCLVQNLFFRLPIEDAVRRLGGEASCTASEDSFAAVLAEGRPDLAIVSLETAPATWERCIRAAQAAGVPVIAFGPHDDLAARAAALAAGARAVYAKGKFTADLVRLIARHAGLSTDAGAPLDPTSPVAP